MIYGVDVGMRRLAVASPDAGIFEKIDLGRKIGDRRQELLILSNWFDELIMPGADVWVESAIMGGAGNVQTAVKLAMTVGVLYASPGPATMQTVAPSSWKAAVCGHGHASKDDVRAWVETHLPASATACADIEDLFDATCIAVYGRLATQGELGEKRRVPRRRHRPVLRAG